MKSLLKCLLYSSVIAFSSVASGVAAQAIEAQDGEETSNVDAERLALAVAIMDISFPQDMRLSIFEKTSDQMEAQMMQSLSGQITDEGALALITKWQEEIRPQTQAILERNVPLIMDAWAQSYAAVHSKKELEDILAFVSTPSGQAFMQRSTDVLAHPTFADANQIHIDQTMELVMGSLPNLMQELLEYQTSKSEEQ